MGTVKKPDMLDEARFNVAAVNACKGISTDGLEGGVITQMIDALKRRHGHDITCDYYPTEGAACDCGFYETEEALAKLEGK